MRPHVLLFDIDGTLISAHGVGRRALNRAFETRFGVAGVIDPIDLQGMTDRLIVKEALTSLGVPATPALVDELIQSYLESLDHELRVAEPPIVLPGVVDLLERLLAAGGQRAIGLGTGNVVVGAKAKLAPVGLLKYFTFGGYGSDHEQRAALLKIGAERGAAHLNLPVEACRVTVIGDTLRDVLAAQAIGVSSLAVATGNVDYAKLSSSGATLTVRDLTCPQALAFLMG